MGKRYDIKGIRYKWAHEDIMRLLHLKEKDGLFFRDIAKELGKTRKACIGMYWRVRNKNKDENVEDVNPELTTGAYSIPITLVRSVKTREKYSHVITKVVV